MLVMSTNVNGTTGAESSGLSTPKRRMWQLLPGRHWPMLAEQEAAFVARITELADGKKVKPSRDDLIMLLTALRCGTDADVLLEHAPGIDAASLLACYSWIDKLRVVSVDAWLQIEQNPSIATVNRFAPEASKLLPIPIYRVVGTIEAISTGRYTMAALPEEIGEASAQIHRIKVRAHGFEAELENMYLQAEGRMDAPSSTRANRIGQRLYDPLTPGIYGDPHFLPDRVSTLSPLRVRDLLGERHVHTQLV